MQVWADQKAEVKDPDHTLDTNNSEFATVALSMTSIMVMQSYYEG